MFCDQTSDVIKRFSTSSVESAFCKKIKKSVNKAEVTIESPVVTEQFIEEDDEEIISSLNRERLTPIKKLTSNSFNSIASSNRTTCNSFSTNTKSISASDSITCSTLDYSCHSNCTSESFPQSAISPSFHSITMDFNINNNIILPLNDSKYIKHEFVVGRASSSSSSLISTTSLKTLRKIKSNRSEMNLHINNITNNTVDKIKNKTVNCDKYNLTIPPFNIDSNSCAIITKNNSHPKIRSDIRSITPLTSYFDGINMD